MNTHCPILYCSNEAEIQKAIKSAKFINPIIISAIQKLIKNKLDSIDCLEIVTQNSDPIIISCSSKEVNKTLNQILLYYQNREEYEQCIKIKQLLDTAQEPITL